MPNERLQSAGAEVTPKRGDQVAAVPVRDDRRAALNFALSRPESGQRQLGDDDKISWVASDNGAARIVVIARDANIRGHLCELVVRDGLRPEPFSDVPSLLNDQRAEHLGCVICYRSAIDIDTAILEREFSRIGLGLPIIAVLDNPDVRSVVNEMRNGAFDVLGTPLDALRLSESIHAAVACHWRKLQGRAECDAVHARYARLTHREREVAELVAAGSPSRDIAALIGVGEKTIEVYRSRIKGKMCARNSADLTRMLQSL